MLEVRGQNRKVRFSLGLPQNIQAEIKFVIAHGGRVVAERIHQQDHRVRHGGVFRRIVISEWCALNRVAGIEQQHIRALRAHLMYQRGNFREAQIRLLVRVVIDRLNVSVEIGGAEQREIDCGGGRSGSWCGLRCARRAGSDRISGRTQRDDGAGRQHDKKKFKAARARAGYAARHFRFPGKRSKIVQAPRTAWKVLSNRSR